MPAEAKGSLYATSSGFGIRWLENGRRRFRSGFETKRDARRWFEDEVRPRLRGRRRESSSSTLADFVDTWLKAHAADVEPGTITTLRYRLAHALATFGDVPLAELQRQALEIAAWRAALPEGLRYPATSTLRQALGAAVAWDLIEENPARKAGRNPQPKAREIRPLTVEELGRVVGEIGAHGPLVTFAAETGLRPCEWLALERRDVDRSARVVYVEREHVGGQTKPYGKTAASRRRVPLTVAAVGALEALPPRLDSGLMFPAFRGGYINLRNWRSREWDTAVESAGLAVCKCGHLSGVHDHECNARRCGCEKYQRSTSSPVPYVLRHTFASNALAAGVGTFELARYMGTSVEMIDRTYGHLVTGADDAFRARLETYAEIVTGEDSPRPAENVSAPIEGRNP
jgi:integrase